MNVGIVGVGLIGGSFALAVRRRRPNDRLFLCERDPDSMARAASLGILDGVLDETTVSSLDLLLIALYPDAALTWLRENAASLSRRTTVVDLAGIKRQICREGEALAREHGFTFVGGHPMAGREVWGISAATPTLFEGASMILCPSEDADEEMLRRLTDWFLSVGFGTITRRTPEDHDRVIAYTSQLAHILSSAYIESPTAEEHRGLSAGSFQDMTRVAAINAEMWSEIFLSNKDCLLRELDTLIGNLAEFRDAIRANDRALLFDKLSRGARRKAACDRS